MHLTTKALKYIEMILIYSLNIFLLMMVFK